ncbi:hypothetical protein HZC30_03895 [Candidatus Woesearchaeota archaeon]|nr:hypothetical protein [Candidatus Woesearchaeota archaeon]
MNKTALIWIMVLGLCLSLVAAIGIRPAATNIIYETSPHYSGTIWVVNNDQRAFTVKVFPDGEMGRYVTLKKDKLVFRAEDDALSVDFEVLLPEGVPPGTSTALIMIEETLDDSSSSVVSSKVILKHKITIEGPYPDKYIKAKLNFNEEGSKIKLISEVENWGKKNLDEVYTVFYVNNKEQQPLEAKTESTALGQKENKLLVTELSKSEFEQGEFEVSAVTHYDDQTVEISKKMLIGKPEVEVTYFDSYFIANKINQYALELLNKWNSKIENVFVDVTVKKEEQKVDQFRTRSVDIEGEMSKRINDYFDAKDKAPGEYSFDMEVNFWNTYKMATQTYHSKLLTEEEFNSVEKDVAKKTALAGKAAAGNSTGESAEEGSSQTIIISIMGGLLLGALVMFIIYRYKHREEYE